MDLGQAREVGQAEGSWPAETLRPWPEEQAALAELSCLPES